MVFSIPTIISMVTGVGPFLKKAFTNKYVLGVIVAGAIVAAGWWAVDTHYELINKYNTLSDTHNELIEKEKKVRNDYNKQLFIIKNNEQKRADLELEYNRVKDILGGIDFEKFKDAPAEVKEQYDEDINLIIQNSYGCIESATGNAGATCVK